MTATYDFSQTRNDIITRALRVIGAVAEGQDPTPQDVKDGAQALESMVKWLQAEELHLWTIEDRTLTIVAGQDVYTSADGLSDDMLIVMQARLRESQTAMGWMTALVDATVFRAVTEPGKSGRPEMAFVELRATPKISFWPIPDINTYTWQYRVVRKLRDFDTALGTPEMPQRWYDPLVYTLAANLADERQLPLDERAYLTAKAKSMREIAARLDKDVADGYYIKPI